ncbi:hypothetical protein DSO57_1006933 [Entomophthora muscae]|uniref:Uncharacterized protein n=1 Tax=Entomophthora muscae TaxID=34485 RepID=A0ACC2SWZ1_9FUNG|nr:hypothetical protein DSO57_1006933 [Entomophthora muscae]
MFYQLWMVHAQVDIWVILLVFFFLPGATKAIYTRAFTILQQELSLLLLTNNIQKSPHTHPRQLSGNALTHLVLQKCLKKTYLFLTILMLV